MPDDPDAQAIDTAFREAFADAGLTRHWGDQIARSALDVQRAVTDERGVVSQERVQAHVARVEKRLRAEWGDAFDAKREAIDALLDEIADKHPAVAAVLDQAPHLVVDPFTLHYLAQLADVSLDVSGAHPARVHRNDLLVEARKTALVLPYRHRIETTLTVPRNVEHNPLRTRVDRLLARPVAMVPSRLLPLVGKVNIHLGVEHPLRQRLPPHRRLPVWRTAGDLVAAVAVSDW